MATEDVWTYTVKGEETIMEIAQKFDLRSDALIRANPHLLDFISADDGELIIVPLAERVKLSYGQNANRNHISLVNMSPQAFTLRLLQLENGIEDNNNNDDYIEIDIIVLQTIMDRCSGIKNLKSPLDLNQVVKALNDSMKLAEANNRRREVGFLSQAVIETDYFRTYEEYGKGKGKDYYPYYGRGIHQLTHQEDYEKCSQKIFQDDRLVKDPDLIIKDIEINIKATAWFWRDRKPFNALSDEKKVDEIIYRLYGGKITSRKKKVRKSVRLRRSFYTSIQRILNERSEGSL